MIDWSAVRPGDRDPEGDMALRVSGVCARMRQDGVGFRCTRSPHRDGIHVAAGTRQNVLAVWGPGE